MLLLGVSLMHVLVLEVSACTYSAPTIANVWLLHGHSHVCWVGVLVYTALRRALHMPETTGACLAPTLELAIKDGQGWRSFRASGAGEEGREAPSRS